MTPSYPHWSENDIVTALTWSELVTSQCNVFEAFARGEAQLAPRALLSYGMSNTAFCYLAQASVDGWPVVKLGSVNAGNTALGLPSVHALVIVMDSDTGEIAALMDGEAVTALRTPAASVAAAEALADLRGTDREPDHVVIVGAGRQGHAHADLVRERYPNARVPITGRESTVPLRTVLSDADLVLLCTTSAVPVVEAEWLAPGTTVVSIGSFAPDRCEFGADLIKRAGVVFVDDSNTAMGQCGPVVQALTSGVLTHERVISIGEVLCGRIPAPDSDIVLYASVGLGIQDAAVVDLLMRRSA